MNAMGKKVATDLYLGQMKWVAWYLPIVYVAYFAIVWFLDEPDIRSISLLTFTFQTTTIFMLVCGIISSSAFLTTYVKYGVTRKSYFQGALLSAIGLAITVIGLTTILTWIVHVLNINVFKEVVLSSLGVNSWLLTSVSYFFVVMIYFLVGWLIGLGFYRYGGVGGFVTIIVAVVVVSLYDLLWLFDTPKPLKGLFNFDIPVPNVVVALIASFAIATITAIAVYKIVKETPIKIA
ncbi:hypothetical protein CSV61_01850 [Sporosarcina sp. P3]|uniref:hypothetical protein n=1 Tax=Sporosarcina sp. P3 TaxID=2048245 RepID=UPI000C16C56F|nr:hypothetical protein [Sporosarcina sp. P3]PID23217.1 hypothetical protein CSV61_01850 [Sporosarcina sp. P3]